MYEFTEEDKKDLKEKIQTNIRLLYQGMLKNSEASATKAMVLYFFISFLWFLTLALNGWILFNIYGFAPERDTVTAFLLLFGTFYFSWKTPEIFSGMQDKEPEQEFTNYFYRLIITVSVIGLIVIYETSTFSYILLGLPLFFTTIQSSLLKKWAKKESESAYYELLMNTFALSDKDIDGLLEGKTFETPDKLFNFQLQEIPAGQDE